MLYEEYIVELGGNVESFKKWCKTAHPDEDWESKYAKEQQNTHKNTKEVA